MQRSQQFLVLYSGVLTVAFAATALLAFGPWRTGDFRELTVERLNVIEPDGTLRMVISNHDLIPGIIVILIILDSVLLVLRLRKGLRRAFPDESHKGTTAYALMRSMQIRRFRLPPPRVKAGRRRLRRGALLHGQFAQGVQGVGQHMAIAAPAGQDHEETRLVLPSEADNQTLIRFAREVRYSAYQAADNQWYVGYQTCTPNANPALPGACGTI